jgi:hypothetical protein
MIQKQGLLRLAMDLSATIKNYNLRRQDGNKKPTAWCVLRLLIEEMASRYGG